MKEKKSHPIYVTILIIILMLVFTCMGYFIGASTNEKKIINSDNAENKMDNSKKENSNDSQCMNTVSQDIEGLFNKIIKSTACNQYYGYFTDKKVTVKDLSKEDKAMIVFRNLLDESNKDTYSKAEVEEMYRILFGKNVTIELDFTDDRVPGCPIYNYDSAKEEFVHSNLGCGCTHGGTYTTGQVVKAIKNSSGIELTVSMVFADGHDYYSDYAKTKVINSYNFALPNDAYQQGSMYKVVFTLEDGNYVLSYVEPE